MRLFGLSCCALGWTLVCHSFVFSQQTSTKNTTIELTSGSSILEFADEPQEYLVEVESPIAAEVPVTLPIESGAALTDGGENQIETELVQTLYPKGTPKVAKYVALDEDGNFVNHGEYQEWSEAGELLVNGRYEMGKQTGLWVRFCQTRDSKLFESEPYKKFKAPFQSTAEFANGELNGIWSITDKDGKKVSEIQLRQGKRNGTATWYHPSGTILWQSEYHNGLISGSFIEKDQSGKAIRQTQFVNGQKAEKKTEYHANKKPKFEYSILTASQILITPDDWNTSTLATFETKGEEVKHGPFTTYYENGSVRSQANYKNGLQDGEFLSWYSNNQRESVGRYSDGHQDGKWTWWHENGMRRASASYEKGSLAGPVLSWNEQGKRVNASEFVNTQAAPTPQPESTGSQSTSQSTSASKSQPNGSSRSASSARRPGAK